LAEYDSNALFKPKVLASAHKFDRRDQLFSSDQLQKSGSISRGISFGSNQDVFVNSNLNLQLQGKLSDDLNILATITDQNIPFQPEGNTQQLQDFDKVLIQLYNQKFSLSVGDVVLQQRGIAKGSSYFLQYYKNVQGGMISGQYNALGGTATTKAGISIAKGKFASIQIDALEGVSGPYRVRGPNNERFIIVLANSEKVFLDGVQLTRGFNQDYVIDYNLGEITFTSRVLITKFSRIRVDFEYSDQNYSKSILSASHQQQWGKTTVFVQAYQERDNANRPLAFDLSSSEINLLSGIGDNLDQAKISGVDSVGFSDTQVLYKLVDTVDASGQMQQVLVFTSNPDSALYRALFTEVGLGQGQYQRASGTQNGTVYQWVGVDSLGAPLGSYEPAQQVTTPQSKRLLTLGITHDLNDRDYVYSEVAWSHRDLNLYSKLDDNDNQGQALKMGYVMGDRALGKNYQLGATLDYEFNSTTFSAIDRFRYVEFDRDWNANTNDLALPNKDHILNLQMNLHKDALNYLKYGVTHRQRGSVVDGFQHNVRLGQQWGRWVIQGNLFNMANDQGALEAAWSRLSITTQYRNSFLSPGYEFKLDRNSVSSVETDSVVSSAMNFQAHRFFIQTNDTLKTRFAMDYELREDRLPIGGELMDNTRSRTLRSSLSTEIGKTQELELLFTYRNLQNLGSATNNDEETLNGRLDWQGSFLDRHIISELNYQVGNGRELRRDFIFLSVPTGQGTHTWRDENQDGIQDLNEFYLAINPDERNYAKIFTPTDEYILAFTNTLNYRLLIDMPRSWRGAVGLKRVLSKFSLSANLNIQNKLTDSDLRARFSPFARSIDDSDLLGARKLVRLTGFYNRSQAKYGFDFGLLKTTNKQLLTDGFEARDLEEQHFNMRYSFGQPWVVRLFLNQKTNSASSDFLAARNFTIRDRSWSPQWTWQPSTNFRVTTSYEFSDRTNVANGDQPETAQVNKWHLELRQTQVQKSTLQALFTYSNIDFEGEEQTAVGYELLQALRPGQNLQWSVNWQLKIAAGLQLQLNYNGRKSAETEVIHSGRMQISALF